MLQILKSYLSSAWLWVAGGASLVAGFLFMLLRLRNAQHKAERLKESLETQRAVNDANRRVDKALRKVEKAEQKERNEIRKRRNSGEPPTGKWKL